MKLSLFKISILLIIIGALGTIIVFSESEKLEQFMTLKQTESDEISLYFEAGDIGYHKVTIPEFDAAKRYRSVPSSALGRGRGPAEGRLTIHGVCGQICAYIFLGQPPGQRTQAFVNIAQFLSRKSKPLILTRVLNVKC